MSRPEYPLSDALIGDFVQLAVNRGFAPIAHITLTYDRGKFETGSGPSRKQVEIHWAKLVRRLNQWVGGKRYWRKWGHSYFGYMLGVEEHRDGVFHVHAVVDTWIDFKILHTWWNKRYGFAWVRKLDDENKARHALRYVLKYIIKEDQQPGMWFQKIRRQVDPRTGRVIPAELPA